jgi:hypothetical protein
MNASDHPVVWDPDGGILWNAEVLHAIVQTGRTVPVLTVQLTREQYRAPAARGVVSPTPPHDVIDEGAMRDQVEMWRAAGELRGRA